MLFSIVSNKQKRSCICSCIMVKKCFMLCYRVISTAIITVGVLLAVLYLCGIRLYHVKSGSMGELLPVGSMSFVSTYSRFERTEVGDVIAFRVDEDMYVTHRAVKITREGITTKGDANQTQDPDPVTRENYIGKTVFAVPEIGELLSFFHTLAGMIVLAAAGILLLLAGVLYGHLNRTANDHEKGS